MCQAYLRNLNSFPAWPPMVCERKLNPEFKEFSRPPWRIWSDEEIWQRRELIKKLDIDLFYTQPNPAQPQPIYEFNEPKWLEELKQMIKNKQIAVSEADLVSFWGRPRRELKYDFSRDRPCNLESGIAELFSGVAYASLNEKGDWQSIGPTGVPNPVVRFSGGYDLFLYKGKAFDDAWQQFDNDYTLGILSVEGGMCRYEYRYVKPSNKGERK